MDKHLQTEETTAFHVSNHGFMAKLHMYIDLYMLKLFALVQTKVGLVRPTRTS